MSRYESFEKLMRDNNLFGEISEEKENYVCVDISWGDWKHEHLLLDSLVNEAFQPTRIDRVITEEDGSDCFSARHIYCFKGVA